MRQLAAAREQLQQKEATIANLLRALGSDSVDSILSSVPTATTSPRTGVGAVSGAGAAPLVPAADPVAMAVGVAVGAWAGEERGDTVRSSGLGAAATLDSTPHRMARRPTPLRTNSVGSLAPASAEALPLAPETSGVSPSDAASIDSDAKPDNAASQASASVEACVPLTSAYAVGRSGGQSLSDLHFHRHSARSPTASFRPSHRGTSGDTRYRSSSSEAERRRHITPRRWHEGSRHAESGRGVFFGSEFDASEGHVAAASGSFGDDEERSNVHNAHRDAAHEDDERGSTPRSAASSMLSTDTFDVVADLLFDPDVAAAWVRDLRAFARKMRRRAVMAEARARFAERQLRAPAAASSRKSRAKTRGAGEGEGADDRLRTGPRSSPRTQALSTAVHGPGPAGDTVPSASGARGEPAEPRTCAGSPRDR
jgi:hypothetical protein